MSEATAAPVGLAPADLVVQVAADVRVLEEGRLIVGGWPVHALRLSDSGSGVFASWMPGGPVGEPQAQRALARRLLEAGILHPRPAQADTLSSLTVVVPVKDRPAQLDRCLKSVRTSCGGSTILVVDDGSRDSGAIEEVCVAHGARLLRHERSQGPSGARNTGLRACTSELVAFVDSDVVLPADWARRLMGHFVDPRVGAVAPRILGLAPIRGCISAYEALHSPLDIGATEGRVAPGRPTAYVPAAVLVVRRSAADAGFDPSLEIGEDVDFVWRMAARGWWVRYVPDAHVWHDHRVRLGEFIRRRRTYAYSVALLAKRHPVALPATRVHASMALPWALAVAGRPRAAAGVAAVAALRLGGRLRPVSDTPYWEATSLVARGLMRSAGGLAQAVRRCWAPLLLVAAPRSRRARAILGAAFLMPIVQDALVRRDLRWLASDAALRVLDEVVALWGTLEGCSRERTIVPLVPVLDTAHSAGKHSP